VRKSESKEKSMIYIAAAIALFLLVYLFTAMIRPEKF
jgi:K+-transporting ATPase KdpF subunit